MFGHLPGADVIDILLLVVCPSHSLVDAGLELVLVELHGEYVFIHLFFGPLHAGIVLIE